MLFNHRWQAFWVFDNLPTDVNDVDGSIGGVGKLSRSSSSSSGSSFSSLSTLEAPAEDDVDEELARRFGAFSP